MEEKTAKDKNALGSKAVSVTVFAAAVALLLIVAVVLGIIAFRQGSVKPTLSLSEGVVIDAGHGYPDGGAPAPVTGMNECDINLMVAMALKAELESRGIKVYMTRSDENAIADTKDDDMAMRREITNDSGAAAFISIHMNAFPENTSVRGPQVFYQEDSDLGEALAKSIQYYMNSFTEGTRNVASDSLYVLKEAPMPAVLVECGFLTNPDEEALLIDAEYQKKLAEAIADGLAEWFGI